MVVRVAAGTAANVLETHSNHYTNRGQEERESRGMRPFCEDEVKDNRKREERNRGCRRPKQRAMATLELRD